MTTSADRTFYERQLHNAETALRLAKLQVQQAKRRVADHAEAAHREPATTQLRCGYGHTAYFPGCEDCPGVRWPEPQPPTDAAREAVSDPIQIVRDYQTVADAKYLSVKSRIDGGEVGLEMTLAVALGLSHQAREIYGRLVSTRQQPEAGREGEARQTINDALMDSQYLAGAKAGWNAAQADDPEAAFAALQKSREGHLAGYAEAKATLAATRLAVPTGVGREEVAEAVEDEDAAWSWLESKWLDVEAGSHPNDRDYSADEMVDAFIAGRLLSHAEAGGVEGGQIKPLRVDWNKFDLAEAYDLIEGVRRAAAQDPDSPLDTSLRAALDAVEAADCEWDGLTEDGR